MKPSHRKDVIIARIIFAGICLVLIAIIVGIIMLVSSHHKSDVAEDSQRTESQAADDVNVPIVSDLIDSEGQPEDDGTVDDGSDDGQTDDGQTADGQTDDGQTADGQTDDGQTAGDEVAYVRVLEGVRLRTEPNTECEILAVCPPGTVCRFISEENGWTKVDFDGQIGYIISTCLEDAAGPEQ